ncbi:MAG: abortive phage infection protein [Phormidesmis priestleyi]|uniref:Abortive phage infection protein n=1 Tax=Phormidesmis priestleyi TaxID=268141 RepID=A0A2W4XH90_9CYAN|nr:MAG: abortive phage infection protein [Phormidesmis priestleyi]
MHIILQKNIDELAQDHGLEAFQDSKVFEFFCNFCVVSKKYLGRFNPKEVTTDGDDAALDGIAVIVDGELIVNKDDAIQIFATHKTNLSVEIVFTQVKSSEPFKKDEIANFQMGLQDFLSLEPKLPNGRLNKDALAVFNVVLDNLKKIRNRRPSASIYYCTSGTYKGEAEISGAFDIIERFVKETDIFNDVEVYPIGRSELLRYWADISEKNEARLKLIDYFGMPRMPDIPQSYVAIVNAKELVENLLEDQDGAIKSSVFEENIRAYLGSDNEVNTSIRKTLKEGSKKKLFSVLNNGITIVAPELTLTPNSKEIDLTNYQIINGCQTSNTLFFCKDDLDDSVNVVVRFIESPKSEVSTDIISATNSQSQISKESFYGLYQKAKLVQKYFDAQNTAAPYDSRVYFERRENE